MKVTVSALNEKGEKVTVTGEGLLARALCHEIDHLDGVLYTDVAERMLTPEEYENGLQPKEPEKKGRNRRRKNRRTEK